MLVNGIPIQEMEQPLFKDLVMGFMESISQIQAQILLLQAITC
jgi:hypothetical protein